MSDPTGVVVVGAGVSGLTSAVLLAEAGFGVLVRSSEPPEDTTSCVAGAMWDPHLVAHPQVDAWAQKSLEVFRSLAAKPGIGVALVEGVEAGHRDTPAPRPRPGADHVRECDPATLPPTFTNGWHYRVPVIDMTVYLSYLVARLERAGGRLEIGPPVTAAELPALGAVVVNCSGLGARRLVPGDPVRPVRGDLLVVDNPGIDTFFVEHDNDTDELTTYILPQGRHVMLGGSRGYDDSSRRPQPSVARAILERCIAAEPRLDGTTVREHRVGLRPVRPQVRLDADDRHPHVIHNYGHGGAGVTLSWGCAQEVLRLTTAARHSSRQH
ncbi:FAD-dependent oxidoreductase [Actinoplanes solisilvae]|uniref:FAD-dependent oxidoreductase n=1 Tax=Actinoplanes solisilvae TaxID=2486853 RepID=UPI000FD872C3|nr:FAD-dependent oxidoreductase [Actinoplanes solisilvae]